MCPTTIVKILKGHFKLGGYHDLIHVNLNSPVEISSCFFLSISDSAKAI